MSLRFCDSCGAPLKEDAAFCVSCGKKISSSQQPTPEYAQPVPPTYSQQTPPTYQQSAPPAAKSRSKTGLIVVLVVLLLAATFAALWFAGVFGEKEPTNSGSVQPIAPVTQSTEPAAQPEPEHEPEPTPEAFADLSTTEVPAGVDFQWYFSKDTWVFGETPENAVFLTADGLAGSWKCLQVVFDYDGTVFAHGYSTATFAVDGTELSMTLDWHYMDWLGRPREELDSRADESLTGVFDPPLVSLGTPGNQISLVFYSLDGKQYAEGVWEVQSGEEVRLMLVRP